MNPITAILLRSIVPATVLSLFVATGASASGPQHPGNVVTEWNAITTEVMIADNRGVLESRI